MENNQKVTQQLYQFQYLKDQRDYFEQQLQFISASRSSLMNAKSTLENIKEGYFEVDLKGNFIFINKSFREIFGYNETEILGSNYKKFAHW